MAHPVSVAPMIQWTDRHFRYYFRLISKRTLLFTEMTQSSALFYNRSTLERYIGPPSTADDPLVLQLGGNDPAQMAEAAALATSFGTYHSVNINCGCPSNRALRAGFGAELMLDPDLTRQIVHAISRRCPSIDVSVKCRVGVDPERNKPEHLVEFVEACRSGGARHFILHARDVVLRGLSPAQNRSVPPLKYDEAFEIASRFPELSFTINGGIHSFEQVDEILSHGVFKGGCMIGRQAYRQAFMFAEADSRYYGERRGNDEAVVLSRGMVLDKYLEYCDGLDSDVPGGNTCNLMKPLHNMFSGCEHEKAFKHSLDAALLKLKEKSVSEIIARVLDSVPELQTFLDVPLVS